MGKSLNSFNVLGTSVSDNNLLCFMKTICYS